MAEVKCCFLRRFCSVLHHTTDIEHALRQIAQRTINTASRRQFENKVPEKQKLFQEDNGIPVHLKGGVADALLYRATMILTVGGTAYAIYQLAMASFPKKQD
ncbi:Cytochrome c oxidase polypeptide 7A2, mitochondrial [Pteropus alecto]|uniref:Cytochrome c oxidase subunit 7A2, mitochondrial n=1 Tax=Pteropus alecto TaxID=9402 RepID=L5JPS2_PTEAL|nr:Cytochrome c oxidase polypeptide 7A2, mitochondrial [Pteropus alecto]